MEPKAGDRLTMMIARKGVNPNEWVAFLEDGTWVIIDGGDHHQSGETITARVDIVFDGVVFRDGHHGRVIYATIEEDL